MRYKINVIWCLKSQEEIDFSREWLKEILDFDDEYFLFQNGEYNLFKNNSFIIHSSETRSEKFERYIEEYNVRKLNYTVVHLSDECYTHDDNFYNISTNVVRNYYHEKYIELNPKTKFLPLGYKSGLEYVDTIRIFRYNFVGQLKSDRVVMKNSFDSDSTFYRFSQKWNDDKYGLNIKDYSKILSSSVFTLCPRGWVNLDSFRICESLECGSIPIVVLDEDGSDYFQHIFPNHPFVISKTWEENRKKADSMTGDDISKKQIEVREYWSDLKKSIKKDIRNQLCGI